MALARASSADRPHSVDSTACFHEPHMRASTTRYVIITPVRDEAANLSRTIESVARQTVRPVEWIIVNDGSTDETGAIIDKAARDFPWLRAVHRSNRGFRKPGGGVVEAFNEGYPAIQQREWDF